MKWKLYNVYYAHMLYPMWAKNPGHAKREFRKRFGFRPDRVEEADKGNADKHLAQGRSQ